MTELVDAYRRGVSIEDLAASFGVNRTTVLGHVRRHGVPKRDRRALREDDLDRAVKLYSEGQSAELVAEELQVAASTVRRALKDAGIVLRPPGRQRRGNGTTARLADADGGSTASFQQTVSAQCASTTAMVTNQAVVAQTIEASLS